MISKTPFSSCRASLLAHYFVFIFCFSLAGCVQPGPPKLPDTQPEASSNQNKATKYTRALNDMNLLLDVYLPPEQRAFLYYVKPIHDKTNISQSTGGEIPSEMGDMVRASFGDISNKIRVLEEYTQDDQVQVVVEQNKGVFTAPTDQSMRPKPNFIISGSISIFDRGLESVSRTPSLLGTAGVVDLDASVKKEATKSHLGVILLVSLPSGVSLPGRFGAEMDVWNGKDGVDVGFAIKGIGFGYTAEGIAIQGRHQALRLISDLSVVQIVGRTLSLPYWRVPLNQEQDNESVKIYDEDEIVYRDWQREYDDRRASGSLIAYMQSACIANGDNSVQVTGRAEDTGFQEALSRFANRYQVKQQNSQAGGSHYPSFEMFKALELNRILDRKQAAFAWSALSAFQRSGQIAQPVVVPSYDVSSGEVNSSTVPRHRGRSKPSPSMQPTPSSAPASPGIEQRMDGLL